MTRFPMLLGSAAEALAGLLLWLSGSDWSVPAAIVLHSISSYFFARVFWQLLPRRYKLPARTNLSFLFVILWILPVLGALGLLWGVTVALRLPRSRSSVHVKTIPLPELPFSPSAIFPALPYSEGALRQIVYFARRPLKRLKAVMATRHMPPREAVRVWAKATRDPVDDVRLLAYAMMDDSEKKLADRLPALIDSVPDVPANVKNSYHKTIAALCWELVYQRLVQGAVKRHWLQTARHHIECALVPSMPALPATHDANSWLLYGRILLESDDLDPAGFVLIKKAFANARTYGADEQKILPWLAEIAFRERKFSDVKRYLAALNRPGEKGRELAQVKAWWGT
jgi:polysaccharide biosynthesis protein PelE